VRSLAALVRILRHWLEKRALLLAVVIGILVLPYSIFRGATSDNDFSYMYGTARTFWQTRVLNAKSQPRYPPTTRVLLAPLASLPIAAAAAVWALLSLAAIAAVPRLLERLSRVPVREQPLAWLAVLTFVLDAFFLGQFDPITLFLVTAGLVLAKEKRPATGASLIGLAGILKVIPLAFWSLLVSQRRIWGTVAGAIITGVAGLGLLVLSVGWEAGIGSMGQWYAGLGEAEGPWGLITHRNSLRENNESLPVVLVRTFGDLDPGLTRNAVSLAHLPLRVIWGIWIAMLGVMAGTWLCCAWRARRAPPERAWLGMFALTAVVMLSATHIAWPHYFMWLLPATVFLLHRPRILMLVAVMGQLAMMIPTLRGLGCHMLLALVLFALVAHDLLRFDGGRGHARARA
jgi:glycosyl transferase family 87